MLKAADKQSIDEIKEYREEMGKVIRKSKEEDIYTSGYLHSMKKNDGFKSIGRG